MVLKTIAVTGASGMVGRHVLTALEEAGMAVVASSRRTPARLPGCASWTAWDLSEWKTASQLDGLFPGAQVVIHAGALVPGGGTEPAHQELSDTNVGASQCLGEWAAARGMPFVFLSGAIVYADPERPGIKETDPMTKKGNEDRCFGGFYGYTKVLAENLLKDLMYAGLEATILRPSSIYGDGLAADKMISGFLDAARKGKTIELSQPADDRINLVHAADVARAALLALKANTSGIFNIPGPGLNSIEDIARACVEMAGGGKVEVTGKTADRPPIKRFDLDGGAAKKSLGYSPEIGLRQGLAMILEAWTVEDKASPEVPPARAAEGKSGRPARPERTT